MSDDEEGPLFYSERPEWDDVEAVEQYEGANPAAPIFYTPQYKDATNYFRGIVRIAEKSERVLELTESVIRQNPAHYSAWQYRYETLVTINASLDGEVKLMDELAVKFLKTYQVWHHRRLLLQLTRQPARELKFIVTCLKEDAKNYHTWSHRQWVLAFFNDDDLWTGELDFIDLMLAQDVRNNSAWHHRFFVVFQSGVRGGEEDRGRIVRRELIFAKQNISLAPNNMSAWNYLRGVLDFNKVPYSDLETFVKPYAASSVAAGMDFVDLDNPGPSSTADLPCPAAIEFLADILQREGGKDKLQKAKELWGTLANQHDTVRKRYWDYRIRVA